MENTSKEQTLADEGQEEKGSLNDVDVSFELPVAKIKEPLSVDTSETETISVDGDRLSIRSQDSSSTPTKPSSGVSTPTDKRSVTPPPGAPKRTPNSGGSGSKLPRSARVPPDTPTTHFNRPNRPGFVWKINGKMEAMDFQKKWYPARIVDLDDTDNTVLIHFDGWNQRYDEWMGMDTERLRPLIRSSGRKERKRVAPGNKTKTKTVGRLDYKLGDNVFAKWTDCRMYAGTIVGINPNGSYEVLFYDGFKKAVQPINIRAMPVSVQKEYAGAGMLPHPASRPYQKQAEKRTSDEYKRTYTFSRCEKGEGSPELTDSPIPSSSCFSPEISPSSSVGSMRPMISPGGFIKAEKFAKLTAEGVVSKKSNPAAGDEFSGKKARKSEGAVRKKTKTGDTGQKKQNRKRSISAAKPSIDGEKRSEGPGPKIRKVASKPKFSKKKKVPTATLR